MSEIMQANNPAFVAAVRLSNIEYSISEHMQGACASLLEVGRCLNTAKDEGLVPHGQWEAWVCRNTGMGERAAQKLMQAARNVEAGSAMARLPISKIQAILSLPEEAREPMAEKAAADNMTLRDLQSQIRAERARADEASRKAVEKAKEAEAKSAQVEKLKDKLIASENAYVEAKDNLDAAKAKYESQLAQARAQAAPAAGISEEAQAEIERLKADLADAEAYAEKQAQLRQEAQRALLEKEADEAHGMSGSGELDSFDLAASVRAFIGSAGVLPHMGSNLAHAPAQKREEMARYVDMVQTWVDGARKALGTVLADASDVQ